MHELVKQSICPPELVRATTSHLHDVKQFPTHSASQRPHLLLMSWFDNGGEGRTAGASNVINSYYSSEQVPTSLARRGNKAQAVFTPLFRISMFCFAERKKRSPEQRTMCRSHSNSVWVTSHTHTNTHTLQLHFPLKTESD